MQTRPCFLVIDYEHASSISSRKLVLETAKYNVITAYSLKEAEFSLQRFPGVHAVVVNGSTHDAGAAGFLDALARLPQVKYVVVGEGPLASGSRVPDALVESFAPAKLLSTLELMFSEQAMQLLQHEEALAKENL